MAAGSTGSAPGSAGGGHSQSKTPQEKQAEAYRELHETIAAMTRWEPRNRRWLRELAASGMWVGWGEGELGRKEAARQHYTNCLETFERLSASEASAARRSDVAWAHEWIAEIVSDKEARAHLDAAAGIHADLVRLDPTDRSQLYNLVRLELRRGRRLERSEAMKALDHATSLLEGITTIDASDGDFFDLLNAIHMMRAERLADGDTTASIQAARKAIEAADKAMAGGMRNHFFLTARGNALRQLASAQRTAGDLRAAAASNQEALNTLKQATDIARQADNATSWNQIFLALYEDVQARQKAGNPEGAARASRELIDAVEKAVAFAPDEAVYRSNQGAAYRLVGDGYRTAKTPDLKRAEAAYVKAEEARRKAVSLENSASNWNALYLLLYDGVAPLRTQQNRGAGNLEAIQRAADAEERAIALSPDSPVYRSNLGVAYRKLGDQYRSGSPPDLKRAEGAYARAEEATRKALSLENSAGNWNALYLLFYDSIASLRTQQGQPTAALDAYRRAVDAADRAIALDPSSPVYRYNLSVTHAAIGGALADAAKPDDAGALAAYRRALAAVTSAVSLSPKSVDYLLWLSRTHGRIAVILGRMGSTSEAESRASHARAVEAGRRATELDAQSDVAWNRFAIAQFDGANAFDKSKERNEALSSFSEGLQALDRAIALNPKDPSYRSSLSQVNYVMAQLLESVDVDQAADRHERSIAALVAARAIAPDAPWIRDGLADQYYSAAEFYERTKKDRAKAAANYHAAAPHARERATRQSAAVDDQLMYVNVVLGIERTATVPAADRAEAVAMLKRLSEQSKLPPDWLPVLKQLVRQ